MAVTTSKTVGDTRKKAAKAKKEEAAPQAGDTSQANDASKLADEEKAAADAVAKAEADQKAKDEAKAADAAKAKKPEPTPKSKKRDDGMSSITIAGEGTIPVMADGAMRRLPRGEAVDVSDAELAYLEGNGVQFKKG